MLFKQFVLQIVGGEINHVLIEDFFDVFFFLFWLYSPYKILLNELILSFTLSDSHLKLGLHGLQCMA